MLVTPGCGDLLVAYFSTNMTVYLARYHIVWCPEYWWRVLVG
jgi:hypothetical protein